MVMVEAEAEGVALVGVRGGGRGGAVMVRECLLVAEYLLLTCLLAHVLLTLLAYLDDLVGDDLGPPPG